MTPIALFILAVVVFAVRYATSRPPRTRRLGLDLFLQTYLVVMVGLLGLYFWFGHTFIADEVARSIGWEPGSQFQFEVAMANLAFGVLGLLCARFRGGFWLATGIGTSVFYLGNAWGHIQEMAARQNYAPLNTGVTLYFADIFHPLFLMALLAIYWISGTGREAGSRWSSERISPPHQEALR